jgi:hypothetical protein
MEWDRVEAVKKGEDREDTGEGCIRTRGPGRRVLASFTVRCLIETMIGKGSEGDLDFHIT